ncbi:MAG: cytochrome c family protein [Armatimonadetes bacterium]|nr:cytochrome c family protein [Armatimonadota bacterium]
MPNIFKPAANSMAKLSLLLGVASPVLAISIGSAISRSSANTGVGMPLDQPIPFSHKHHAYELGIDCRYCHTGVEVSGKAGVPQTETCMTCHSQIWTNSPLLDPVRKSYETGMPIKWNQVNKAPDFVYFNHCHGAIQKMHLTAKGKPFFMVWCLECHNQPEKYLYKDAKNPQLSPRQQVFNLYSKIQTDPEGHEMNEAERNLLEGTSQAGESLETGAKLVLERGLKKAQLKDCSVCHH